MVVALWPTWSFKSLRNWSERSASELMSDASVWPFNTARLRTESLSGWFSTSEMLEKKLSIDVLKSESLSSPTKLSSDEYVCCVTCEPELSLLALPQPLLHKLVDTLNDALRFDASAQQQRADFLRRSGHQLLLFADVVGRVGVGNILPDHLQANLRWLAKRCLPTGSS